MDEQQKFEQMIEGKDEHFSETGFFNKLKGSGSKLGFKGLHAAATLYTAVKSPNMSKANKLIMLGALGYFILPFDVVADILPVVGLTDDLFVITTALAKVVMSIDDEMKEDAHRLLKKVFGERYKYEEVLTVDELNITNATHSPSKSI